MRFPTIYRRYANEAFAWKQPFPMFWSIGSIIEEYFVTKWRQRMADAGAFHTAKQMRKQGIPLGIALLLLFGVKERLNQEPK